MGPAYLCGGLRWEDSVAGGWSGCDWRIGFQDASFVTGVVGYLVDFVGGRLNERRKGRQGVMEGGGASSP